jgi:hypothetical protein
MQHLKTTIHKENLKKLKSGSKQQTIAQSLACSSVTDEQEFYFDLCNSMVSSNIPLTKLNNNEYGIMMEMCSIVAPVGALGWLSGCVMYIY